jgi:hypothetical protein
VTAVRPTSHKDYISYGKVAVTRHRKRVEIVQLLDNRCSKPTLNFFYNSQIFILKCLDLFYTCNLGNIFIIGRQMGLKVIMQIAY